MLTSIQESNDMSFLFVSISMAESSAKDRWAAYAEQNNLLSSIKKSNEN